MEKRPVRLGLIFEILFLIIAALLPTAAGILGKGYLAGDLAISFVSIVIEALPFLLFGTLVGGLVETFVSEDSVRKVLEGRSTSSIFIAASLGFIFPVCECAIVPVTKRLMGKGVPLPAAVAFLLAVPIFNPLVAASTAIAYRFDWFFVITRLACGYLLAVSVGLLVKYFRVSKQGLLDTPLDEGCHTCHHSHDHKHADVGFRAKLISTIYHGCEDFFLVAKYLIIGAYLAAVARTFISMDTFAQLSANPWLAILVMMILAVLLNLCSEADAFIAAAFRGVVPQVAQMAFLVIGPMLDLKLILMYSTMFRWRLIFFIGTTVFSLTFILMLLMSSIPEVFFG